MNNWHLKVRKSVIEQLTDGLMRWRVDAKSKKYRKKKKTERETCSLKGEIPNRERVPYTKCHICMCKTVVAE